eukprot:6338862-Amphidinium_carterae.1
MLHFEWDASNAFLHARVGDEEWIVLVPHEEWHELNPQYSGHLWLMRKMLYGLRRAPQAWLAFIAQQLKAVGFTQFELCPCFYKRDEGTKKASFLEVYMDDVHGIYRDRKVIAELGKIMADYVMPKTEGPFGARDTFSPLKRTRRVCEDPVEVTHSHKYVNDVVEGLSMSRAVGTPRQKITVEEATKLQEQPVMNRDGMVRTPISLKFWRVSGSH